MSRGFFSRSFFALPALLSLPIHAAQAQMAVRSVVLPSANGPLAGISPSITVKPLQVLASALGSGAPLNAAPLQGSEPKDAAAPVAPPAPATPSSAPIVFPYLSGQPAAPRPAAPALSYGPINDEPASSIQQPSNGQPPAVQSPPITVITGRQDDPADARPPVFSGPPPQRPPVIVPPVARPPGQRYCSPS